MLAFIIGFVLGFFVASICITAYLNSNGIRMEKGNLVIEEKEE